MNWYVYIFSFVAEYWIDYLSIHPSITIYAVPETCPRKGRGHATSIYASIIPY